MSEEVKEYKIPEESLPHWEMSVHLADLIEIQNYLENKEINVSNTRISRYKEYLEAVVNNDSIDVSSIFSNSKDVPFKNKGDWHAYIIREVHELMWILKGLKIHEPLGIEEKLKVIVNGSDFAVLDKQSISRDLQFELRIASYFCQSGFDVDLSCDTDIIAIKDKYAFYMECKRVGSVKQLSKRIAEAKKQLKLRMPKNHKRCHVFGGIVIDVTKAAFPHNGLTFGMTNEHSRDYIQEKLTDMADAVDVGSIIRGAGNIIECWMQIHIPAIITYPPSLLTRFSSFFLTRDDLSRKGRRADSIFKETYTQCSKADGREVPPRKLKRRTKIEIPEGTKFNLDEKLIRKFLKSGELADHESDYNVAELEYDGEHYEFSYQEFCMLSATISEIKRKELYKDMDYARLFFVMELYGQRFPYEDD